MTFHAQASSRDMNRLQLHTAITWYAELICIKSRWTAEYPCSHRPPLTRRQSSPWMPCLSVKSGEERENWKPPLSFGFIFAYLGVFLHTVHWGGGGGGGGVLSFLIAYFLCLRVVLCVYTFEEKRSSSVQNVRDFMQLLSVPLCCICLPKRKFCRNCAWFNEDTSSVYCCLCLNTQLCWKCAWFNAATFCVFVLSFMLKKGNSAENGLDL